MSVVLTDLDNLQQFLAQHGVFPVRSESQNFLICEPIIEATLLALQGGPFAITELGAGVGTLTQALVNGGYRVRAIEKDDRLISLIPKAIAASKRQNLEVIHGDLKEMDWTWDEPYSLVGNIPYHLSGLIIRRITQLVPVPARVVLLTQYEVGQRMESPSSLLGLAVGLWGTAHGLLHVPANCFWPAPKVASQLTLLIPASRAAERSEENEQVMSVARQFFQAKRKQMGGQLARAFDRTKEEAKAILNEVGLTPTARPEELSVEAWRRLAEKLT